MKISFYQRRPYNFYYSIEAIFDEVRYFMPKDFDYQIVIPPQYSKGILNRLKIIFYANKCQGDINHITGDIHFVAIGLDKRKTILTIHDCRGMEAKSFFKRKMFLFFWLKIPVAYSTHITVVSEKTKNDVIKYTNCDPSKISIIPSTISHLFQRSDKEFNSKKPNILQFIAAPNKNALRVVESLSGISCKLILLGKTSDNEIFDVVKSLGIDYEHHYNLSLNEVVELYKKSDIVSFPSTYEGFGMPILEGQAVGRPILTSNIHPMIETAGEGACFIDPFDILSIRNGFLRIIENETYRDNLILKGFMNFKKHEPQEVASKYYSLYRSFT